MNNIQQATSPQLSIASEGALPLQAQPVGSLNGVSIAQVEPSGASKLFARQESIASLLEHKDSNSVVTSIFIKDLEPLKTSYTEGADKIFEGLRATYPTIITREFTAQRLTSEQQKNLEEKLPAGALEPWKGTLLAKKIVEAACNYRMRVIEKVARNYEQGDKKEKLSYLVALQHPDHGANCFLEKLEMMAVSAAKLGEYNGYCLESASFAEAHGETESAAELKETSEKFQEVMTQFSEFTEKEKLGTSEALSHFLETTQETKNGIVEEMAYHLVSYYEARADQASAGGHEQEAKNFRNAAAMIDGQNGSIGVAKSCRQAADALKMGNKEEVQIYEKALKYSLSGAQAYALGTPESLAHAKNLSQASAAIVGQVQFKKAFYSMKKDAALIEKTGHYMSEVARAYESDNVGRAKGLEVAVQLMNVTFSLDEEVLPSALRDSHSSQAYLRASHYLAKTVDKYASGLLSNPINELSLEHGDIGSLDQMRSQMLQVLDIPGDDGQSKRETEAYKQGVKYFIKDPRFGLPASVNEKVSHLAKAAKSAFSAGFFFEEASKLRNYGKAQVADRYERAAKLKIQASQGYASGTIRMLQNAQDLDATAENIFTGASFLM